MTINDIAKAANVSIATVSRVINNSGYVKKETRDKIYQIIKENNFVPSAVARNLSTKDTSTIGVVIPDIGNEFFASIISGINEVAEQNGYNIFLLATNESVEKEESLIKTVESQRLKGVIITPVSEQNSKTSEYLLHLESKGIPVILVDRDITGFNFNGVYVDNVKGTYDGVTALIEAGHKDIAIITGPDTSKPGKERLEGYQMALKDNNIPMKKEYIAVGDFKIDMAYIRTKELLSLPTPPSAIFTSNNLTTLGCLKYLVEYKYQIGKDISIIGFDDIEALNVINYNVSVIKRDAKQQGQMAMQLMLDCLNHSLNDNSPIKINIPYELVLRGSEKIDR